MNKHAAKDHAAEQDATRIFSGTEDPTLEFSEVEPLVNYASPVQKSTHHKSGAPIGVWVVLLVLLLGAIAYTVYKTYELELWGPKTLPDVSGLTEQQAVETLESKGFSVSITYETADTFIGRVLSMSPQAGKRISLSETVYLTVATSRIMPDVCGLDVESARSLLEENGLSSIETTVIAADLTPGTVLAQSPEAGESFVLGDTVTLTISRAYQVPEVVGLSLEEAQRLIEEEGLAVTVSYTASDEPIYTVLASDPAAGEALAGGSEVCLSVASPSPASLLHLIEYFSAAPEYLAGYITSQGFTLTAGSVYAETADAYAQYKSDVGDVLTISDEPESAGTEEALYGDVLQAGSAVGGIRFALSAESLPAGAASETLQGVQALMDACGFEVLLDSCTAADVVLPEGTLDGFTTSTDSIVQVNEETGELEEIGQTLPYIHFICAYGTQGDYTWAAFIGGIDDQSKVVVMAAPSSHFESIDLSLFGDSVCDYVVYRMLFN